MVIKQYLKNSSVAYQSFQSGVKSSVKRNK